jgi:YidC/Oxa1 family membrane protein insertase
MTGLLESIQTVVRNYGVAIIVLVLIIRALLHPLTVFQQKSMYRMQEAQARLQPKLAALKERYANDKVRLNQETMKLYGEEGVNPMAGMVGMLPMLIQMPILIALWTALNTDVHLRHAGFDPWWITDLSAPDALIEFSGDGITIPILGWLPLIGTWFTNVPSLNLLPILMGVSMWLQQKYMPKPGMQAKLEAAKKAATQKKSHQKRSGMSPEDQARQQQMIMYMMSIFFPLMFYRMPSGLNLYWMSTNVFGIAESLRIRKQLQTQKERREREGPPPVKKKPGVVGRVFKHLAARAEELQKRADQLSKEEAKQQAAKRSRDPSKRR